MNVTSEFLPFVVKIWYAWAPGHDTTMSENLLLLNKNCVKDIHKFILAWAVQQLIDYCYTIDWFFLGFWSYIYFYHDDWFSLLYSTEDNVETILWKDIPFVALSRDTLHKCWSYNLNIEWSRLLPCSSSMKESWEHMVLRRLWESLTS